MTTFSTSRWLNASPEAIYQAICEPERLARWWGPNGFTNSIHTFEFKPGGRWVLTMHGPDGSNYFNESEFLDVVPNDLVSIRHISQPEFVLSIRLQAQNNGTLLSWEQVFADAQVAQSVRHIVEPSNEQNLDRLGTELGMDSASKAA